MHFYRPLSRIAALTFDLDDTLYDNYPVIQKTTQASLQFLQQYHPSLRTLTEDDYSRVRDALRAEEPEIYHDVTQWRWRAIERTMQLAGIPDSQAREGADAVMAEFAHWRSRIEVPQETHTTLAKLAEKWPLVAITNGNADPSRFGLGSYFQFVLRAGPDGRSKPFGDMYWLAAQKLGLQPGELLHVGDDLTTDVSGAVQSGVQACWINLKQASLMTAKDSRLLPHVEISRLASLTALI
jgi:putative hydrolase of the HAD superfamily